jgi:hypothetical protein
VYICQDVEVYRLVTEGTMEERMQEVAQTKLFLHHQVTRDGLRDASGQVVIDEAEEDVFEDHTEGQGVSTAARRLSLLQQLVFGADIIIKGREGDEVLSAGELVQRATGEARSGRRGMHSEEASRKVRHKNCSRTVETVMVEQG